MHGDPKELQKVPLLGNVLSNTAQHHLQHHNEVNMDMTLNHNRLDNSLFFSWSTLIVLFLITLLFGFGLKRVLKFGNLGVATWALSIATVYSFLWNNIHLDMHKVEKRIPMRRGISNFPQTLNKGPVYRWLWKYHAIHHLQKGSKGNFNIVLPGCDNLFGTYQGTCFDNREYCKNTKDSRCDIKVRGCMQDTDVI